MEVEIGVVRIALEDAGAIDPDVRHQVRAVHLPDDQADPRIGGAVLAEAERPIRRAGVYDIDNHTCYGRRITRDARDINIRPGVVTCETYILGSRERNDH